MSTLRVNNITDLGDDYPGDLAYPGQILQVVSTTKTDTFTTTSTSYVDVTGLTASITPTSASSKILVSVTVQAGKNDGFHSGAFTILRDGASIINPDSPGVRAPAIAMLPGDVTGTQYSMRTVAANVYDSPSTTSSVEYKIQAKTSSASGDFHVNRSHADTDNYAFTRGISTITLMEVAG